MLSYAEMKALVSDLSARMTKRKVQKLRLLSPTTLAMELYGFDAIAGASSKRWLVLVADPKFGRLHLLREAPPTDPYAHPFGDQLKKHIKGAGFVSIALLENDRIAELHFESKQGYRILILELLGSLTNCFLLDENRHILGSLRPMAPSRGLSQRDPWVRPPAAELPDKALRNRYSGTVEDELHNAVEADYANQENEAESESLRSAITKAFKRERDFIVRKMEKIDEEMREQSRFQEFRRYGDLLKAYLNTAEPVDGVVSVTDYDEEGNPVQVEIPVDPALSMQENMEAYFKKFRKGAKGSQKLGTHLSVLVSARSDLDSTLAELDKVGDDELGAFSKRSIVARVLKKYAPDDAPASEEQPKLSSTRMLPKVEPHLKPRACTSIDGWEILVGKGAAGNDYLTTQLANGNDTFLHVDGVPGSHVIIRSQGGELPPPETLMDGAMLAMYFSKMKTASKANVSYIQKKHVKKPKGAKPGLVVLNQRNTLTVRMDDARMARLLGKELG